MSYGDDDTPFSAAVKRGGGNPAPFLVPAGDPILAGVVGGAQRIHLSGIGTRIANRDASQVTMQSTKRPHAAPSWAWGFTPQLHMCWLNVTLPLNEQEYSCLHEWAHSLDDRYFSQGVHLAILARMGTEQGWNQGTYTEHSSDVPREGFADSFARAVSGGGFKGILPTFYKTRIKPSDYQWLLDVVAEAMHIK